MPLMSRSPVSAASSFAPVCVRTMVAGYVRAASKSIVSAPLPLIQPPIALSVFAAMMASRSEHRPSPLSMVSLVVVTVMVEAALTRDDGETHGD